MQDTGTVCQPALVPQELYFLPGAQIRDVAKASLALTLWPFAARPRGHQWCCQGNLIRTRNDSRTLLVRGKGMGWSSGSCWLGGRPGDGRRMLLVSPQGFVVLGTFEGKGLRSIRVRSTWQSGKRAPPPAGSLSRWGALWTRCIRGGSPRPTAPFLHIYFFIIIIV